MAIFTANSGVTHERPATLVLDVARLLSVQELPPETGKATVVSGPVSHGRTVSFTGIRLLVFGYYEYQYLVASNRFNLSVSQNLNTQ
jgi:hypothetical protein